MVNYNNSKVYKIQQIGGEGDIYIGATTKKYLSQRMVEHRSDYKLWKQGKRSLVTSFNIFEKYGIDNCQILLIELVNCNTKDELLIREAFHIKANLCVNKYIPNRSNEEYRNDNKEHIKQYRDNHKKQMKIYHIEHKEIIKKRKVYNYQKNKMLNTIELYNSQTLDITKKNFDINILI